MTYIILILIIEDLKQFFLKKNYMKSSEFVLNNLMNKI